MIVMFPRLLAGGLTLLVLVALVPAQEKKAPGPKVIKLAPQAAKKPASAFAYQLLPDPLDRVDGNAAFLWNRSVMAVRSLRYKWTEEQYKWSDAAATTLDKLAVKEVKKVLDAHAAILRLADQAALRTRCDWERPAPTVQNLRTDLPLDEIQGLREIAHLLTLRCRVELAERRFDDAARTLQTGFTLARHLNGDHPHTLIEDLVGIAIASIMLSRVEEWVQIPGSPNLYWALTELPRPFISTRPTIRVELGTVYRSFPALRELKTKTKKKLSKEEASRLVEKVFDDIYQNLNEVMPPFMKKMGITAMGLKYYPIAKKGLIASGRSEKEVDTMPTLQVVAIYYLEQYDQMRDEILQCLAVPAWQGHKHLEKVQAKFTAQAREDGNILTVLTVMLVPAFLKVNIAELRLGRQIAGLRGAEALRMHFAVTGSPPAKWADIKVVPGPTDPVTGKGFDEWYKLEGNTGVLDIPAVPSQPILTARRFEMGGKPAGRE
jgi:hypothetical protein